MANILATIETTLKTDAAWVEKEAGVLLTDAEKAVDTALQEIWGVAAPIFTTAAATEAAAILASLKTFLAGLAPGQDLATLETAFLDWLEKEAAALLPAAQSLGSLLLQALIALALKAI